MGPLLHSGLALATSLSSLLNVLLLVFALRKRIGGLNGRKMLISAVKLTMASIIMGLALYWVNTGFYEMEANVFLKVMVLFGNIVFGIIIYLVLSFFLKTEEVKFLMDLARNKLA